MFNCSYEYSKYGKKRFVKITDIRLKAVATSSNFSSGLLNMISLTSLNQLLAVFFGTSVCFSSSRTGHSRVHMATNNLPSWHRATWYTCL